MYTLDIFAITMPSNTTRMIHLEEDIRLRHCLCKTPPLPFTSLSLTRHRYLTCSPLCANVFMARSMAVRKAAKWINCNKLELSRWPLWPIHLSATLLEEAPFQE